MQRIILVAKLMRVTNNLGVHCHAADNPGSKVNESNEHLGVHCHASAFYWAVRIQSCFRLEEHVFPT